MASYFVEITGEHPSLGKVEVQSLVEILDKTAHISWTNRFGIIETRINPTRILTKRAAYVRKAGRILKKVSIEDNPLNLIDSKLISEISPISSFSVRTNSQIKKNTWSRERLTREIGRKIKELSGARVDLDNPQKVMLIYRTSKEYFLCDSHKSTIRSKLRRNKAGHRPFFHPSMMNSFLARAMCNLAGVMPGDVVLDPFCGAGGILYDIASLGAIPIGMDLNWRLLTGARSNLQDLKHPKYEIIQGSAFSIPITICDAIVTDPPYGRGSSTRGEKAIKLVETVLEQLPIILKTQGKLCIGASSEMNVDRIIIENGYYADYQIRIPVHKGLVREIFVIRN